MFYQVRMQFVECRFVEMFIFPFSSKINHVSAGQDDQIGLIVIRDTIGQKNPLEIENYIQKQLVLKYYLKTRGFTTK